MNTGEKIDDVIQILWNYYDGKNEILPIESSVLRESNIGVNEFRVICGRLTREGILKENPFATFLPYDGDVIDDFTFNRLFHERDKILSSSTDSSNSQSSSTDTSWVQIEELNKKMDALDRIFTLSIDGKKLGISYEKLRAGMNGKAIDNGSRVGESSMVSPRTPKPIKHLISKDANGYFSYNGELIKLRTTNIAYDLLYILYSHSPTGGFLTYKEIGDELRRRNKGDGSQKSIQNALGDGQGFFGIAKVGRMSIPRHNPDGKDLIEIVQGEGLQFNNPPI